MKMVSPKHPLRVDLDAAGIVGIRHAMHDERNGSVPDKGGSAWRHLSVLLACALVLAFTLAGFTGTGHASTVEARTEYVTEDEIQLPLILEESQVALYKRIFSVQEKGHWKTARKLIKTLKDRSLMGHVLAQRYLHPTKYRSRYRELRDWLKKYADHPQARRIYRLAMRRKPAKAARPRAPRNLTFRGPTGVYEAPDITRLFSRSAARRRARQYARIIRRSVLRRGRNTPALKLLQKKHVKRLFRPAEYDRLLGMIGYGYLMAGQDRQAYDTASQGARRSGGILPETHWVAGLAAFRLERMVDAARHFTKVGSSDSSGHWLRSAGHFWSSRANYRIGLPAAATRSLREASQYPTTFYGILALRSLGIENQIDWNLPLVDADTLDQFARHKAGKRAFSLLQAGRSDLAEGEIRRLALIANPWQHRTLISVVTEAGMATLAMQLGHKLGNKDNLMAAAIYPVPNWKPMRGFTLDRALMFAMIRQESAFRPRARSRKGARGLMQVMPGTARFVARSARLGRVVRARMNEPGFNMQLGQSYLHHLLDELDGNLFHVIAAYNAGPGNIRKWHRRTKHFDDPLMFIESMRASETRDFVERVITNLWMYRLRLGQPVPSLNALASGYWPSYQAVEKSASLTSKRRHGD